MIAQLPGTTGYLTGLELSVSATGLLQVTAVQSASSLIGVATAGTITDGATHHAAATYNGTTVTLYVDGALVGSDTGAAGTVQGSTCNVGGGTYPVAPPPWVNTTSVPFTGTIAHVAATRSVLTAGEIAAHATAGLTGFAGERTDQRLVRILGWAGVAATEVTTDTGVETMTYQQTSGQTVVDAARDVESTEGGVLTRCGGNSTPATCSPTSRPAPASQRIAGAVLSLRGQALRRCALSTYPHARRAASAASRAARARCMASSRPSWSEWNHTVSMGLPSTSLPSRMTNGAS